jgi:hypothetical protein
MSKSCQINSTKPISEYDHLVAITNDKVIASKLYAEYKASTLNFDDFLKYRNADLESQYSKSSSIYTSEYLNLYLNPNPIFLPNQDNWAYWSKYDRWDVYALGLMVSEILVNIKGIDSYMIIYQDVGAGKSFVDAFQGIYGLSWAEACPIIADAMAAQIKQGIKK